MISRFCLYLLSWAVCDRLIYRKGTVFVDVIIACVVYKYEKNLHLRHHKIDGMTVKSEYRKKSWLFKETLAFIICCWKTRKIATQTIIAERLQ